MLRDLSNPLPSTHRRAIGVSEGCVFSTGEQVLHRLGVSLHELTQRQLILLNKVVYIIYGRHLLEITSIVASSSFPSTLCDHPTLFTQARGSRGVLGTSPYISYRELLSDLSGCLNTSSPSRRTKNP